MMQEVKLTPVTRAWLLLKLTYGLAFLFGGVDKFFNVVISDWTPYMGWWIKVLPLSITHITWLIGILQVVFGLITLSKYTRIGALGLTALMFAAVINFLGVGDYYHMATCYMLAMGTLALAQLSRE